MQPNSSLNVTAVVALLLAASSLVCVCPAAAAPAGSRWGADYFPNVPLITQDGKTVHFYDDLLKGKIVAIDLIYTHCQDSCPLETARLAQVQRMLGDRVGKDIFFYSISVDPKRDTPAELKAYAEKFHAGPGWLFLQGKQEDVELISKKLGLYSDPDPSNRDGHTPSLLIGNEATGQWMRNSALDNTRFLALMIGDFLNSWKNRTAPRGKSYTEAAQLTFDKGQYLFATRCAACHSIGHGDKIGPDLLGVTQARDRAWLSRFIAVPDKVLSAKDPIATALYAKYKQVQMPDLRLDAAEVEALLHFLETQTAIQGDTKDEMKMDHADMKGDEHSATR
jgi:protein SCO1